MMYEIIGKVLMTIFIVSVIFLVFMIIGGIVSFISEYIPEWLKTVGEIIFAVTILLLMCVAVYIEL